MANAFYITAGVGILLSLYSLYVEHKAKHYKSYKAVCDISDRASCSTTFKSDYGQLFGISNGVWGILFYLALMGLLYFGYLDFVFYGAVFGILFSIRLAYILYFKLKNFCLICNGIYLVNILLLIFSWLNFQSAVS